MNSYILRIYREEKNNPRKLAGIVEQVGVDGRRGFTNLDELWEILNQRPRRPEAARTRSKSSDIKKGGKTT